MLDSGLIISWGEIVPGRQEHALLRLLSEVVAYYDNLLEEGRISGFEPFVLGGRGLRGLRGFMIIRGTPEQITIVRHDDELLGYLSRARKLMQNVGVQELYLGDTLRHTMVAFEHPQGRRGRVALGDALPPSGGLEPPLQLRSRTQPRTVRCHQIDLRDVSRDRVDRNHRRA